MNNRDRRDKLVKAEDACRRVQAAWREANNYLSGGVGTNGYGIYHDRGWPLRMKLEAAQAHIQIALKELNAIEWPTDADYDAFEQSAGDE